MGLKKQFDKEKGWNEELRDQKLDRLIDVILKYVQVRIHATIRHDEFDHYFRSVPAPKRHLAIEDPYVLLAMQLILAVAAISPGIHIFEPCDFIFDEQGAFFDALVQWYPIFKRQAEMSAKTDIASYMCALPKRESDIDFMPLQAADLYAGLVRRHCDNNKLIIAPPPVALRRLMPIPEISRNYMAPELKRLNDHLRRVGHKFYASNPAARRLYKQPRKKQRNRRNTTSEGASAQNVPSRESQRKIH